VFGADGSPVASCGGNDPGFGSRSAETYERRDANARLIAAAPELYETLGHIRELLVAYGPRYIDKAVKLAADALAKARGETA
jgi:hypothetical protein